MAEWVDYLRGGGVPACIGKLISNIDLFNTDSYGKVELSWKPKLMFLCVFLIIFVS